MITLNLIAFLTLSFLYVPESKAENADLSVLVTHVSCSGAKDGAIQIVVPDKITRSFTIVVKDTLSNVLIQFNENSPKPLHIDELESGHYTVWYRSGKKADSINAKIESPENLKANLITIESISGQGESLSATIKANPTGGTAPYTINWSENTNNQEGAIATNLPMGVYRSTINDANNCGSVSATFFLFESEIEKFKKETEKK
ncbi:hypothetical protein ES708_07941 [subsurface metagenome]